MFSAALSLNTHVLALCGPKFGWNEELLAAGGGQGSAKPPLAAQANTIPSPLTSVSPRATSLCEKDKFFHTFAKCIEYRYRYISTGKWLFYRKERCPLPAGSGWLA